MRWLRYAAAVGWSLWMYAGLRWGVRLARNWPAEGPSNCYIWALRQRTRHGGDLRLLTSRYGPWLHCRWVPADGSPEMEFNPVRAKSTFRLLRWRIPPPIFRGRVERV
jgi:hypothetical protein